MARAKKTRAMSDAHKVALAEGREQGRAIRRYLEALEANKPRRGRQRTPDSIKKTLEQIETQLGEADPLKRLQLIQQRLDLEAELGRTQVEVDVAALEEEFVAAAAPYAERKRISYTAFREIGVPVGVLRRAGIGRGD